MVCSLEAERSPMTPSNLSNGKERNVDRSPVAGELVGESELIRQVRQDIEIAASLDLNVLIIGEPGTGKELVAHGIHKASDRGFPTSLGF